MPINSAYLVFGIPYPARALITAMAPHVVHSNVRRSFSDSLAGPAAGIVAPPHFRHGG